MGEHWIGYIGQYQVHWDTLITMWFAMAVVIVLSLLMTRKMSYVPSVMQAFGENLMKFFIGSVDIIGEDKKKHIPLVASLFLFILFANLMGQLPLRLIELKHGEFASPTNDINMTAAMAVLVLFYYLFTGLKAKGFRAICPEFSFVGIIEMLVNLLEMITRPFSLALRLFVNILVGEILVTAMLGICAYFLPLPIMLFEILVAFIQAYVFMMLTVAYISSSVSENE